MAAASGCMKTPGSTLSAASAAAWSVRILTVCFDHLVKPRPDVLFCCPAGNKGVVRGTLAQLRSWAREGLHGVKLGALIVRCSDKLQLLLQEVCLSDGGLGTHSRGSAVLSYYPARS